ncbi:MAG TPA: hypothetical protein PLM98_10730 [Thiolinea sp.]|nr:hypothetical protein [Thiolinea sp.]
MKKIILFLILIFTITACHSTIYSKNSAKEHPSSTQSLMEFCAQSGGKYEVIQEAPVCLKKDSVCTLVQYHENKCINFNQCNIKPVSCETGTLGTIEGYCPSGLIMNIQDACGCVTGLLCKTN